MEKHLRLLGFKVRDVITGFEGTVTSISFDISGCIQAIVQPEADKGMKIEDSRWFGTKRLFAISKDPVTELPTFASVPGGQKLPQFESKPLR